jgi:4-hydroxybenzoate polyprenyltransferase
LLILKAVLIGFFGFEAGLILNDIVDADIDKRELASDDTLTKYWRPFGERPIPQGLISRQAAIILFATLVTITSALIFTIAFPHSLYVFIIMIVCYSLEIFYQLKKRKENFPVAQLIGRINFALFLVAGYLCAGNPDWGALTLFLFFYPLAEAHLGVNDLIDAANDEARGMKTIPILYDMKATTYWILAFSMAQLVSAVAFLDVFGSFFVLTGFAISFLLITIGNAMILRQKDSKAGIKALPLFHLAMLIYAITLIVNGLVVLLL